MPPPDLRLPERSLVHDLAGEVERAGGRLVVVGGWVRDRLLGKTSHDLDVEIFGLSPESITSLLRPFGFTKPVGRQFPVWRQTRECLDASFPRAASDRYSAEDPDSLALAFREASRHRDLTCNAIGWDPLCEDAGRALIDPWRGREDLERRWLRAVDSETFGADPVRVLRVARLAVCLEAQVDEELVSSCRELDLREVANERIAVELRRILLECAQPSRAFDLLVELGQLEIFGPVAALRDVAQDPTWHPEGDVYVHTGMVVDRAAEIAIGLEEPDREVLLFAALCHDLGKVETTRVEDGRIRSLGHEAASAERTRAWLASLRLPEATIRSIETLVAHHLAPGQFVSQGAGLRAYRRLARKLSQGGVTMVDLERLARADHLGRTTEDARLDRFPAGSTFLDSAAAASVSEGVRPDVVSAAQLMERGIRPGPALGRLLERCRAIEDETGLRESDSIIECALGDEPTD
jgi:tRNA nucleotidyltransferase (CCA-adding enzyme)